MQKIAIVSLLDTTQVEEILNRLDFEIVEKNPDFVLVYGGDGTVLFSEQKFPSLPKLVIKKHRVRKTYEYTLDYLSDLLEKIRNGEFKIQTEMKLTGIFENKKIEGLNEIQLHTIHPTNAVRFSLEVNKNRFEALIGDGVVIATPFGSEAYYSSTGGKSFSEGIGISFNNLYGTKIKDFVIGEESEIGIEIERGPAWMLADNNKSFAILNNGDVAQVRKSNETAKFVKI